MQPWHGRSLGKQNSHAHVAVQIQQSASGLGPATQIVTKLPVQSQCAGQESHCNGIYRTFFRMRCSYCLSKLRGVALDTLAS